MSIVIDFLPTNVINTTIELVTINEKLIPLVNNNSPLKHYINQNIFSENRDIDFPEFNSGISLKNSADLIERKPTFSNHPSPRYQAIRKIIQRCGYLEEIGFQSKQLTPDQIKYSVCVIDTDFNTQNLEYLKGTIKEFLNQDLELNDKSHGTNMILIVSIIGNYMFRITNTDLHDPFIEIIGAKIGEYPDPEEENYSEDDSKNLNKSTDDINEFDNSQLPNYELENSCNSYLNPANTYAIQCLNTLKEKSYDSCKVINLSQYLRYSHNDFQQTLKEITNKEKLIVIAAGNNGSNIIYEAEEVHFLINNQSEYKNRVIIVGSTQFSTDGEIPAKESNYIQNTDNFILAPGCGANDFLPTKNNNGEEDTTTSEAAALVSGILGFAVNQYNNLSIDTIKDKLFSSANTVSFIRKLKKDSNLNPWEKDDQSTNTINKFTFKQINLEAFLEALSKAKSLNNLSTFPH